MPVFTCKTCGWKAEGTSPAVMMAHYAQAHPGFRSPKVTAIVSSRLSPSQAIAQYEQRIREEILNLEIEREELHQRILKIDDLVAKYKHLQ